MEEISFMNLCDSKKRAIGFACAGMAAFGLMWGVAICSEPCAIQVDGKEVAVVSSKKVAKDLVAEVVAPSEKFPDLAVSMDQTVEYVAASGGTAISEEEATEILTEELNVYVDGVLMLADGVVVAQVPSVWDGDMSLDYLKLSYKSEDVDFECTDSKIREEITYLPAEIKVADLMDKVDVKYALKGVETGVPLVTVANVYEVTRTAELPYDIVKEYDSSMTYGKEKIKQKGINGEQQIDIMLVEENGEEVYREISNEKVLVAAVDEIIAQGAVVQMASRSASVSNSGMIWPTTATRISSYFGPRSGGFHTGLDIDGNTGDPVWAAKSGVVTQAGYRGSYGYCVTIDHGNGLISMYAHLSEVTTKEGVQINIGEPVGLEGSTGNSSGSHLHFEIRLNGNPVDPLNYIAK